MSKTKLSA